MNRLLTSVLVSLVGMNAVIQADPSRPRLVVGIVVDQLRSDYLEYLRDLFGENGFRKLMENGVYLRDVDFKASPLDFPSATAAAMTGNYPASTGITAGAEPFNTPERLLLSTISDEIAVDGGGMSVIYSIAPDAQTASMLAGHAGNSAVWISPENGNWSTSGYYEQLPQPAANANRTKPLSARIDTVRWKPLLPIDKYPGIPVQKKFYDFSYTFPRNGKDSYIRFTASPIVNREITDLAIEYLRSLKPGNRSEAIDVLNIGYTVAPYKYQNDSDFRLELEDSYIRLDSQLTRLLEAVNKYVGIDNTLIYLTSTGYYDDATPDDPKFRIPSGDLSVKRMTSLLNSFLSAKYGNGDYVESYSHGRIKLNQRTLDSRRVNPTEVAEEARAFLSKMQGISHAYTLQEVLSPLTPGIEELRLAVSPADAADIFVTFNPGWTVTNDFVYPPVSQPVRSAIVSTPALILSPALKAQTINTTVSSTSLAPTVTGLLHIRSPNGTAGRPLPLELSKN